MQNYGDWSGYHLLIMAIEHPPFQGRWMTWGDGNPATDWAYAAERAGEVALNHPFWGSPIETQYAAQDSPG